jgi:hypothetical protein
MSNGWVIIGVHAACNVIAAHREHRKNLRVDVANYVAAMREHHTQERG